MGKYNPAPYQLDLTAIPAIKTALPGPKSTAMHSRASKYYRGLSGQVRLFPVAFEKGEGCMLEDADGNVVEFSSFKGKYVYVDLWASWCGPCCKEVPHLQALEKELQNENVVFLSISTDTDKEAWKKKMVELGMHGNQLHDRDNTLCNALNVKGIPFFLIYDKEGKLHTYKAMRPSSGDALKAFLEALE